MQLTARTPIQIPPQPSLRPLLLDSIQPPVLARTVMDPQPGTEGGGAPVPPQTPPGSCGSGPGPAGKPCWSLDLRVAVLLLTLAGAVILLLLYRLLLLRHRLSVARARHALQYHGFYRAATYTLKHPAPCRLLPPDKNGTDAAAVSLQVSSVTTATPIASSSPPPPLPAASPPPLPLPSPPVLRPPSLPLPLPLPSIHTTPPSPHLSWGACSDAEVYARIGVFRASRLSSLSNLSTHSKVILFEHSSL